MIRTLLMTALVATGTALAAQTGGAFFFSPVPRWTADPGTDTICDTVRRECAATLSRAGNISREAQYDELYDARGFLRGVRLTHGTGCPALDEYAVFGARRFIQGTTRAGEPELTEYRAEGPTGANLDGVRIVRHNATALSIECNPG